MSEFVNPVGANLLHGAIVQFSVAAINLIGQGEFSAMNTEGETVFALPYMIQQPVVSTNSGTDVVVTW